MKSKSKLREVLTTVISIVVVIAVVVACTSVLGRVLDGIKPPDYERYTSLISYDFSNLGESWEENGCVYYEDMYITKGDNPYINIGVETEAENSYLSMEFLGCDDSDSYWYEHHGYIGDYIDIGDSICHVMDVDVELIDFVEGAEFALRLGFLNADGDLGSAPDTSYRFYPGIEFKHFNGNTVADNHP